MTTNTNNKLNSSLRESLVVLSRNYQRVRFFTLRLICLALISSLLTVCTLSPTLGQEASKDEPDKNQMVTASVTADGVRISAPSEVVQVRLEVYDDLGQKLFDSEQRGGNLLDWHYQGNAGERVGDGTYLLVVTIKNPGAQRSQKLGLATVSGQTATLRSAGVAELSPQQAQAVGPIEVAAESLAVVPAENAPPVTLLAHTGDEAQLTRSRGPLTFRSGDFFGGKDSEQMRLTEDGRLGIGTDRPQATLDVAGSVRTQDGIVFGDGSVLKSANDLKLNANVGVTANSVNGVTPNAAGSGTAGAISKWIDGAGTLGDSVITDSGGNIGIGTTTPNSKLHLVGKFELGSQSAGSGINPTLINPNNVPNFSQFQFYPASGPNTNMSFGVVPRGTGANLNRAQFSLFNTDVNADPTNYEFASLRARGPDFIFGTGKSGTGLNRPIMFASGLLSDNVTNNGQLYLATNGNVGVGTTNPTAKLEVTGGVKLSGANSSLTFPDGTSMTTASAGGSMSGTSIVNAVNDPATTGTINDTRLSGNVARLNAANTFAANQSVNGSVNATGTITAGGRVESNSGGFKYPDGSVQTSAADKVFTTFPLFSVEIAAPGATSVLSQLTLPAGTYMVTASVQFENRGLFNKRLVSCGLGDESIWFARIEGSGGAMDFVPVTLHTVINHGGTIRLDCQAIDGGSGHSNIFASGRRMTAVRIGELVTQ